MNTTILRGSRLCVLLTSICLAGGAQTALAGSGLSLRIGAAVSVVGGGTFVSTSVTFSKAPRVVIGNVAVQVANAGRTPVYTYRPVAQPVVTYRPPVCARDRSVVVARAARVVSPTRTYVSRPPARVVRQAPVTIIVNDRKPDRHASKTPPTPAWRLRRTIERTRNTGRQKATRSPGRSDDRRGNSRSRHSRGRH